MKRGERGKWRHGSGEKMYRGKEMHGERKDKVMKGRKQSKINTKTWSGGKKESRAATWRENENVSKKNKERTKTRTKEEGDVRERVQRGGRGWKGKIRMESWRCGKWMRRKNVMMSMASEEIRKAK